MPREIIRRKRDGFSLADTDIAFFVSGIADGSIDDASIAAFAMATLLRGMTPRETIALTNAMRDSGTVLDWARCGLDGAPIVDKHSTGGIGDKTSLILAPLIAACGGYVPMLSGRGLGHTGGTLDKLQSIPGYRIAGGLDEFVRTVRDVGCAIVGATSDLAPADRRLYAVRDVTATVESLPLITASILSKKLAAGVPALVMDVKTGSGAFMAEEADARALADSLVAVGRGAGMRVTALLTDMNQVLGRCAGNALELREAIDFLTGGAREPRLAAITLALAAEMLVLCGLAPDTDAARALALARLDDGSAAERFARMIATLGGPPDLFERPDAYLRAAAIAAPVAPERAGFVTATDARAIGLAIVALGGGRNHAEQSIDHSVGLSGVAAIGDEVGPDTPVCLLHAPDPASWARAACAIQAAMQTGPSPPPQMPPARDRIAA